MKIIVLGMDNTGKTTLCQQLSEQLNTVIIKSPGPNLTQLEMDANIWANMTNTHNLILERFCFFEEMVYGKILRGKSKYNFRSKPFEYIKEANPVIVYCRPSKSVIKNWKEREQMEGVIDNSDKLLKQFDKVIKKAQKHGLKVIKYNYKQETVFDVIAKL